MLIDFGTGISHFLECLLYLACEYLGARPGPCFCATTLMAKVLLEINQSAARLALYIVF